MKKKCILIITLFISLLLILSCKNHVSNDKDNIEEEETRYSILFKLNGGAWISGYQAPESYSEKAALKLPDETKVIRNGYSFIGWYDKDDINSEIAGMYLTSGDTSQTDNAGLNISPVTEIEKGTHSDKVYYAMWRIRTYSISYNLDNGAWIEGFVPPDTFSIKEEIPLPQSDKLFKEGFDFGGWYDNADYSGTNLSCISKNTAENKQLYAKWIPKQYNITFCLNGGEWKEGQAINNNYTIEQEIILPDANVIIKSGYGFAGWYDNPYFAGEVITKISKGATSEKIFYAKWIEGASNYTIRHYKQNIYDNDYTLVLTSVLAGITGTQTAVTAESYQGFSPVDFLQKVIAADGSTFIEIYYDRNSHTVSYFSGIDSASAQMLASRVYRFEEKVDLDFTLFGVNQGYSFVGWKSDDKIYQIDSSSPFFYMPDNDVFLTEEWKPDNVSYVIRHYKQNLQDDNYTMAEEELQYGLTGSLTQAISKQYQGFDVQTINNEIIKGDGSTIIEIKYNRIICTVNYSGSFEGIAVHLPETEYYKYGANVPLNFDDIDTGGKVTFEGWMYKDSLYSQDVSPSLLIHEEEVLLTASWGAICNSAFENDDSLTTMVIPDGITRIGDNAFKNCTNLTKIVIPQSVTSFGNDILSNCKNITVIKAPYKIIKKLENISKVEEVVITDQIKILDDSSFERFESLNSLVIPDSVKYLGDYCFKNCKALSNLKLPKDLQYIGTDVFEGCRSLNTLTISNRNMYFQIKDGLLYDISLSKLYFCPRNATKCLLPTGLFTIDPCALDSCYGIEELFIPDSLYINANSSLKDVINSLTNLRKITAPITLIPNKQSITYARAYVDYIGNEFVDYPEYSYLLGMINEIEVINDLGNLNGLKYFTNLNKLIIPGDRWISADCFSGVKLDSVEFKGSSENCDYIFENHAIINKRDNHFCGFVNFTDEIIEYEIPDFVESVGDSAFKSVNNISKVFIPASVSYIDPEAFDDSSIYDIEISSDNHNLTFINHCIFHKNEDNRISFVRFINSSNDLIECEIPEGVKEIYAHSFYGINNISKLTIPSTVEYINPYAFMGSKINSIEISENNASYTCINNSLIQKYDNRLVIFIDYSDNDIEYEIPDGIEILGEYCFHSTDRITSLIIPDTVIRIEHEVINPRQTTCIKYRGSQEQWNEIIDMYWDDPWGYEFGTPPYEIIYNYTN